MTRIVAALALVAVLLAAVLYNIRARQAPTHVAPSSQPAQTAGPIAVTTETARLGSISEVIRAVGVVRADREAAIAARFPSRILEVRVREGSRVRAGETVARLDLGDASAQIAGAQAGIEAAEAQLGKAIGGRAARRVEMDSQVAQAQTGLDNARVKLQQAELGALLQQTTAQSDADRARAAVLQAEAGVKQAEIALDQAEKTLKRLEFLYSRGGAPRAEMEGARTQAEVARSQKDGALAALRQAQAAEKPASESAPLRERVSRQDIEAARLGVRFAEDSVRTARRARTEALAIADRDIESARALVSQAKAGKRGAAAQVGSANLSSPIDGIVTELASHAGEFAQPGIPLMTIISTDGAYIEVDVAARYAALLGNNTPAEVLLPARTSPLQGFISDVLPVGQEDGRTVQVRVELRSEARLLPGTSATVTFKPVATPRPIVPMDAVRSEGGSRFVYVLRNGAAERREVQVGASDGRRTAVLGGISEGERVIVTAAGTLAPGIRVKETEGSE